MEYMIDNKKNCLDSSSDSNSYVGKRFAVSDTIMNYRVNNFSLITNDFNRIIDLIRMNLNNMLKSDYLFAGVINSSKMHDREYKLVFKKVTNFLKFNFLDFEI